METLEDKAREYADKYDISQQQNKTWVKRILKECYIAGHQSRDEEVKRLEEVVLEMSRFLENCFEEHSANYLLGKHSSLIKELKERG